MGRLHDLKNMIAEKRLGFAMEEVMTGTHEFEAGQGEPGQKFMEFHGTWGPKHLTEFFNPLGGKFLYNDLKGFVTVEGLCDNAPMVGSLELLYFTEAKIRYTFTFEANIVELYRKDNTPDGILTDANVGETGDFATDTSVHAIVDFGALDVDAKKLIPHDPGVRFFGNSSDLTVFDLGENPSRYETGDVLKFNLKYMAAAQLMNAQFVDKIVKG